MRDLPQMNPTKTFHAIFASVTSSTWISQEESTRFQYYSLFLMFGMPLMLIFGVTNFTQGSYWVSALATLSASGLASGWLLIKYRGKGIIIYRINAGLYLLLLSYLLIYGGEGGSKVLWIYTFPLVSFFLFGKREGVSWSGITVSIIIFLMFYPNHTLAIYPYHFEFKIRLLASYLTVTGIAFWLEHLRHHYSTSLQAKNKALNDEITERKKIEKQREQLMLEVQSANQAKSDFLANMSHEIRTPLNGVIGMTAMLLDTELDKQQKHYAKTLLTSGEFLLTIINDILDVSKIEAGKFELNIRPFNLHEMLDRFIDIVTRKIYKNNVEFVVWTEPTIPPFVSGDADRLQQILLNLTSNALKFTHEGNVTVRVSKQDESSSHITLHFSVKDTGIGIAKEDQSKLFQSFSQIDTSTTREYSGTGLGLNISKQLSKQMSGDIGVTSTIGEGSDFWFVARLEKHHQGKADDVSPPPLDGKSALIVTGNNILGEMLKEHLIYWGATVQHGLTPALFLKMLQNKSESPDIDLLIIDQTDIPPSSDTFLDQLLRSFNVAQQRVILLQEENEQFQHSSQTTDIKVVTVKKPIRYSELEMACTGNKLLEIGKPPACDAILYETTFNEGTGDNFTILLAEDNPINREVLLGLLVKAGIKKIDTVANGVDVLAALERKTYNLILMDVSMPKMDGITATEKIRKSTFSANSPQIPIIALTAHAIAGDRERCLQAGMNDYLTKPIKPQELLYKIKTWMPAAAHKTAKANNSTLAIDSAVKFKTISQFDYSSLLERMLGDEQLVRGVLDLFFTEVPQQLEHLSESIDNRDFENADKLAHKLAGGVANLSINRMHAIAKEIQHQCKDHNIETLEELLPLLKTEFREVQRTISQLSQ